MNTGAVRPMVEERGLVAGRLRLWLARVLWIALALVAVALFALGLPPFVENLQASYLDELGFYRFSDNGAGEVIMTPYRDGQAARAGVMERDVLEAVDGRSLVAGPAAGIFARLTAGPPGSEVTLDVRTGNRPARQVTLTRGGRSGRALAALGLSLDALTVYAVGVQMLASLIALAVAGFIFWRRAGDGAAWLASLVMVMTFVGAIAAPVLALYDQQLDLQYLLDAWNALVLGVLLLFLFRFPSGRFVPRWTAAVMLLWLLWAVTAWFVPDLYFWRLEPLPSLLAMIACLGLGLAAQVQRYRADSDARQKQQTKWVVWGIAVSISGVLVSEAIGRLGLAQTALPTDLLVDPLTRLLQLAIPITLALAIWRYRLWDIDLVINRTLVYGTLTAVVVGLYVLLVGGLGALFQAQGNLLVSLLATGVVAVMFQPLRGRLQRAVNRLMYGERDDPFAALAALGRRLEVAAAPEAVLPVIVETVTQTLRVPYAAVALQTGQEPPVIVAATGQPPEQTVRYPMRYQAGEVGALLVAPRAPGEPFSPADERLLRNLARQAGAAVQAVQLTRQLRQSRQRIVAAREEERRRLRRDLHDGLGPQLASQTLGLQAVAKLLEDDPAKARRLLAALQGQAQEAILDVRRLVYDLRPPALDELGLAGALRESIHRLETAVQFTFDAPADLPELPAAVEVAAYRIAQEAMTNVVRHAAAQRCTVRLALASGSLLVEVSDDGRGLPLDPQAGVGLQSMRERAAELNGRCLIETQPGGGVRVRAVFPLEE